MFPVFVIAIAAGLCVYGVNALSPAGHQKSVAMASPAAEKPRPVVKLAILEALSPNQDERPPGVAIDTIIVHDTETPGVTKAQTIANHFLNPRSQVSAHYIIGKDGEVMQCVADERRAWHAGPSKYDGREKVNDFSIGIELVNAQTGKDPFTDAQYTSLIALTADLVTRHPISLSRITGHRHVTNYPRIKRDPADNFDWKRYLDGVKALTATHQVRRLVQDARTGRMAGEAGLAP